MVQSSRVVVRSCGSLPCGSSVSRSAFTRFEREGRRLANQHLAAVQNHTEISGFSISDYKGSEEITVHRFRSRSAGTTTPCCRCAHSGRYYAHPAASLPPLLFCLPPLTELVLKEARTSHSRRRWRTLSMSWQACSGK